MFLMHNKKASLAADRKRKWIYAMFMKRRWLCFTDSLVTVQYIRGVSIFLWPSNSWTCSIDIPTLRRSVALVRRNRCGWTFSTPAAAPSLRAIASRPLRCGLTCSNIYGRNLCCILCCIVLQISIFSCILSSNTAEI